MVKRGTADPPIEARRVRTRPQSRHLTDRPRRVLPPPATSVGGAVTARACAPSWYVANFASTAGQKAGTQRRTARYALRGLLRQPGVSALPRVARCGTPIGDGLVAIHAGGDGTAHTSGLETCASIWSCPVCAAKIRNFRSDEIGDALGRHLAAGGGAVLATLTLPHDAGDRLSRTVELVSDGFRAVNAGRAYGEDRAAFGVLGHIRSFEITHGENGWHPHLHVLVVTERPATSNAAGALQARWQSRWDRWLVRNRWRTSVDGIGVRVDRVRRDAEAVGAYMAKLQEGEQRERAVGNEMTRADLKSGRAGGRVPFEILADFGSDGNAADLDLWHEFQLATRGRSAIRWSRGLRALLVAEPEATDEEIAAAEVGGTEIARLESWLYRAIAGRPYGEAFLLIAAEQGGAAGIARYVKSMGLDTRGLLYPNPSIGIDKEGL